MFEAFGTVMVLKEGRRPQAELGRVFACAARRGFTLNFSCKPRPTPKSKLTNKIGF